MDKHNKICWDDYWMIQALWSRVRSPDPSTQHGCIIVDENNMHVAQGYNGYPRNCNDNIMPKDRPLKYEITLHSECNALLNLSKEPHNATAYITGHPCTQCLCKILQKNIKRIVYGPIRCKGSYKHINGGLVDKLLQNHKGIKNKIEIIKWVPKNKNLIIAELFKLIDIIS